MNASVWDSFNVALVEGCGSLNIIFLLPLNCYNIWLMLTGTKRTLDSDIFSFNLALSETFVSLNQIWSFIYFNTMVYKYFEVYIFSLGFLFTGRPLFQSCICIEYYLGVVHPVVFLKWKPLRYRVVFCLIAWLTIFASCVYCFLHFIISVYQYAFFIQNLLFMAVVVFCCFSVLKALKNPGPGENSANKKQSNASKQRAFKLISLILISMVVNFIFSVAPIPLQCCLSTVKYTEVFAVCVMLSLVTGIMQPLLYLHRAEKLTCFKKT